MGPDWLTKQSSDLSSSALLISKSAASVSLRMTTEQSCVNFRATIISTVLVLTNGCTSMPPVRYVSIIS
ncbi:hypothetical protein Taro_031929 [Colocasia esculenta]|uniref:Uncharacterized protein n=1 Tax=Colocasia esculenta TaxID=4460 RepID=A0A843VQ45_COLES|nr:hypothetical protein [Colocasia esculenta]